MFLPMQTTLGVHIEKGDNLMVILLNSSVQFTFTSVM